MVICPDCGKDVKEAKFCSNCGSPLPDKIDEVTEKPVGDSFDVSGVRDDIIDVPDDVLDETENQNDDDAVNIQKETDDSNNESVETETKNSKFCVQCGKKVASDVVFCPQCGYQFAQEKNQQTKFCQSCGEKININAEICPHCGVRVTNVSKTEDKSVLLAAILSFLFPGLGHLYLGLNNKGILFIILYIISAILILLLVGMVLVIIVWIWALIDSIKSTEALNRGEYVEDKLF